MKTKVLIIEDNVYKFFTTKQVLEAQLKVDIQVVSVHTGKELIDQAAALSPDLVMFRSHDGGGIGELLLRMKKRNTNRRNTEITLLVTQEVDDDLARLIQQFVSSRALGTATVTRVADAA